MFFVVEKLLEYSFKMFGDGYFDSNLSKAQDTKFDEDGLNISSGSN